ncbi:hypothetical protein C1646_749802 [Rhizophagus diaphanus]|nr:hypothetical protein C1646_749802 [Rhizophagus diaphanus] [Rhizophagus sp. MUCL 43196]
MSSLSVDVLFLVFGELESDNKSLYSCILVNKTWCATAIPILWRNPGQYLIKEHSKKLLSNVILSHIPTDILKILDYKFFENIYQRPFYNYIHFWKYLDITYITCIFSTDKISNLFYEIIKLFINKNTKISHLSIGYHFDCRLHIIPGAKCCLSELKSLRVHIGISIDILEGLATICKSIKKLRIDVSFSYFGSNYGIIRLIEVQKNLNDVNFKSPPFVRCDRFNKTFEESLIKHADTIKYLRINWKPNTSILSYLVNLVSIDLNDNRNEDWSQLEEVSLPLLKILKVKAIPYKYIENLIKSTKGNLSEISICYNSLNSRMLIQTIYHNCPNLRYLKLELLDNIDSLFIKAFEILLTKSQFLNGLIIRVNNEVDTFGWKELFEILTKSSSINLFKFYFHFNKKFKLEDLKFFFDNWKDKNPMLLIICGCKNFSLDNKVKQESENLMQEYKTKGIIKRFELVYRNHCKDFEWN